MLNRELINKIEKAGKSIDEVSQQLNRFKDGYPFTSIDRPCVIGDGIISLSKKEAFYYQEFYQKESARHSEIKFIPSSGAASRMFKSLFSYYNDDIRNEECDLFFKNLKDFSFYDLLARELLVKVGKDIVVADEKTILKYLLMSEGLSYGDKPKGLILFHQNDKLEYSTPIFDHIEEACQISCSSSVQLHFTISKEHESEFLLELERTKSICNRKWNKKIDISYSFQKEITDTIAVDMFNQPFLLENDDPLFRPAGHGALIANLSDLNRDLVYIKNIDNVLSEKKQGDTILYKQILNGLLLDVQKKLKGYFLNIEDDKSEAIGDCILYLKEKFGIKIEGTISKEDLLYLLYRPIRVCGMVKNQGEPGGGPFWINGSKFPQIVEKAQVDGDNASQIDLLLKSSHFNPVDISCYITSYKGEKYYLNEFIDTETGFISQKSLDGRDLKALELPGLWNGAMANWLTLFVEVPLSTFNPVKTITDLLKKEHQQ
jgi:hypothetical protein